MDAVLVNPASPGTPTTLADSRLRVGRKLYKVHNTGDGLLRIRRGRFWEYYRATDRQFVYRLVGSTDHPNP